MAILGCYQDVTIWNKWRNHETGKDEAVRHVIPVKCVWKNKINTDTSGGTAAIANSITVIIPYSVMYRDANAWKDLSTDDRANYFTIQKGDVMALGMQNIEVTGVSPYTESEVKIMFAPDSLTIKAYQDNTRSPHGKHFRIEGI